MNQEESEHNEVDGMKKGVDSKGEVMQMGVFSLLVYHAHVTRKLKNTVKEETKLATALASCFL